MYMNTELLLDHLVVQSLDAILADDQSSIWTYHQPEQVNYSLNWVITIWDIKYQFGSLNSSYLVQCFTMYSIIGVTVMELTVTLNICNILIVFLDGLLYPFGHETNLNTVIILRPMSYLIPSECFFCNESPLSWATQLPPFQALFMNLGHFNVIIHAF